MVTPLRTNGRSPRISSNYRSTPSNSSKTTNVRATWQPQNILTPARVFRFLARLTCKSSLVNNLKTLNSAIHRLAYQSVIFHHFSVCCQPFPNMLLAVLPICKEFWQIRTTVQFIHPPRVGRKWQLLLPEQFYTHDVLVILVKCPSDATHLICMTSAALTWSVLFLCYLTPTHSKPIYKPQLLFGSVRR